jgi:hypothetical protein
MQFLFIPFPASKMSVAGLNVICMCIYIYIYACGLLFAFVYFRSHLDPRTRFAAQDSRNLSSLSMSLECKSRGIRFGNELVARQVFSMNRATDDQSLGRVHDQMNEWCVKLGYEGALAKVMRKNELRERVMMSREDSAEHKDVAAAMLRPESLVTFASEATVEGVGKDNGKEQSSDDAEEEASWFALWIQVRFDLTNGNTVTLNKAPGEGTVKETVDGKYKLVSKAVVKARQEEEEAVWLAFREQVRIELNKGNEVTLTSGPSGKATSGPVKGPLTSMYEGSDEDKDSSDDGRRGASSSEE